MRPVVSGLLFVFLLAAPAAADELRLKNGDRITGQVVSLDAGKLTFKTPGGDLIVAWDDVTALTIDQPMLITVKGGDPELRPFAGLALGDVVAIAAPPPPLDWTGRSTPGSSRRAGTRT